MFHDFEAISQLGDVASYEDHVLKDNVLKKSRPHRTERRIEEYIPWELVPLWCVYRSHRDPAARATLAEYYTNTLCRKITSVLFGRYQKIRSAFSMPDELLGYTYFPLLQAMERYNPAFGVKFETFANKRIYWGTLSELRKERVTETDAVTGLDSEIF